jgi:hypothetical protein
MLRNSAATDRSLTTYRVQDLPGTCDRSSATLLIEAAVRLNKGCSDLKVHSLANDPCYRGKKTATITSRDLAGVLPEVARRDRWAFELLDQHSVSDEDGNPTDGLTIDTHFEGFTPLNSYDDEKEHLYE